MALRYNPATGQYDPVNSDPNSLIMSGGDDYFDPVLGDIDPLNEHKGVGGGDGNDNSYTSVGVDPSTLWDPTKGIDWNKLKQFITSPQGIAGLGGAALGYLDRPKPSGGGTTMAYPGAAKLERKMVQGPYGPIAEYTGVGGGAPDYTRFTAPKVEFPTVGTTPTKTPSSGMSVQAKVDLYKQLRGYGLSDERVRRIAETMFGPQTDSDWSELTRRAGPAAEGIAAPAPRTASPVAAPVAAPAVGRGGAPAAAPAPNTGGITTLPKTTLPVSYEDPANFTGPPSLQVSQGSTAAEKAEEYRRLRRFGLSDGQIRGMADAQLGKQTDSDWQALVNLAMPTATGEAAKPATSSGTTKIGADSFLLDPAKLGAAPAEDPFIKSLREAMGGSSVTPDVDPSLYATYGSMAPGTPQKLVYSKEDEGLVYQPSVRGQDLGGVDFSSKAFDEVKNTLERFKANPPKTQEELTLANSAWNEYQNRFASGTTKQFGNVTKNVDQFGNDTGSYNSNLKPVGMLAQEYSQFGPLNELLSGLSSQAAEESGGISTTPFSHTAGKLNTTLSTLQANPLVQQTINRISAIDPSVKFSVEDVGQLSGAIQEYGAENAVRNFIRDKQNSQAVTSAAPGGMAGQNQTMSNQTYAGYQDLLNQITPQANQADWESMAARTSPSGNRQIATLWRDPTSGKGVGVATNMKGLPAELVFYDASGQSLNSSIFSPEGLYREAEKYGIDLSNIGQLGSMLEQKNIGYKPGELYAGTGSNAGIDFEDIARGGLGGKDDWTKADPLMGVKFEAGSLGAQTAAQQQNERQALAERLGIKATSTAPDAGLLDVTGLRPQGGRTHVAYGPFGAAWYDTAAEAQAQAQQIGGRYANLAQGPIATNPYAITPATQIAGPPTPTAQQTAAAVVGTPFAATPAAQPARDLTSLLPSDWGTITDPSKKIDWFNQKKATQAELERAGVKPEEIAWMRQNKLGTFAGGGITQGYAHGGRVQMEDGGFVMTKRAVDGAGGPRGIQQLVPGARMIRGPGTGTSDDVPAVINGRNGQTPALLSNGEAYVPKRFVQNQGGPQRMYALMNNLQRKA